MPAANSVNSGQQFVINDFAGVASVTKTITLLRNGADTINGVTNVVAINAQYGAGIFWSDGVSRWTFQPISSGTTSGTVTNVSTGSGLNGGPITTSGTLTALPQAVPGGRLALQMSAAIGGVPTVDVPAIATKVVVLLPGTTTWVVPADFTATNTISTLGASGGGGGSGVWRCRRLKRRRRVLVGQ